MKSANISPLTGHNFAKSQPIKKSPREFIIPIAVEGGGYITPREGSSEHSDSSHNVSSSTTTTHTTAGAKTIHNRFRPTRRIG